MTPFDPMFSPMLPAEHAPAAGDRPVVAFVRLHFPDGIDRALVRSIALGARSMFEGRPALRSKFFTVCGDTREVVNVYLWESERAARAFFTKPLLALVGERYGVSPRVEFGEIDAIVDNAGVVSVR
jgi:hypothetical protein